jgi:hypothetical protein
MSPASELQENRQGSEERWPARLGDVSPYEPTKAGWVERTPNARETYADRQKETRPRGFESFLTRSLTSNSFWCRIGFGFSIQAAETRRRPEGVCTGAVQHRGKGSIRSEMPEPKAILGDASLSLLIASPSYAQPKGDTAGDVSPTRSQE